MHDRAETNLLCDCRTERGREDYVRDAVLAPDRLVPELRQCGFDIVLFYLWTPGVEFSAERVASRVESGGHDIPLEVIARRYLKSLRNLFQLYMPLSDRTLILDNSGERAALIADMKGTSEQIIDGALYAAIRRQIQETDYEQD